ncbi:MAG: CopG family transcriptional regulator [Proteobacteria bacterium]|nr:CopG family transcriptional regulator [Pseudomonadota bacterium]
MKATSKDKKAKKPTADEIAEMAMNGKDISTYFSNKGKMKPPVQRVNVDFTVDMLKELDEFASELNISRQAVIKSSLRQILDQHNLAKKTRMT